MAEANPTARQRELSRRLRTLREQRNLTVNLVAEQLLCSATKISRIETAKRRASLRDIRDLCQFYEVSEAETAQLMELGRGARETAWWTDYGDLGVGVGPYLGLEQEAKAITYYSMSFVNGLLQTEAYARAIIRATHPLMDDQTLKERVEARLRRQDLLEGTDRPRVRVLLDESVLRRQVGGHETMTAQLDKILQIVSQEKATIQVVPFSAGAQASTESNFTLFDYAVLPSILHVEGLLGDHIRDQPAVVERYSEVLDHLRDTALSPRDSQVLITEIRDAHQGSS
ncbi:MAG: helix-turn-helix transcriptional regulator [Actinomycetota bacterium]